MQYEELLPHCPLHHSGGRQQSAQPSVGHAPDPQPGQTPHPGPSSALKAGVPITDGTPAPCRQKNAEEFLAGHSPGVMDFYAPEIFAQLQPDTRCPAPDAPEAVRRLEHWREQAPYG